MQHTLPHTLRRCFAPALFSLAVGFSSAAQAAATFNPATGELVLPAVELDWEPGLYAVSLKRAALGEPLRLGDEFSIARLDTSTATQEPPGNFLNETQTAYVPEVLVNTAEGEKAYRLLLRMMPNGALRVTSLEDATLYSAISGDPLLSQHMQRLAQQIAQAEMPVSCSNESLYGIYAYAASGKRQVEGEWRDYFEIGVNYFDGLGTVYNAYTNSLNSTTHTVAGSYSVGANCRGEMNYETGDKFLFYTPPMGDKFFYIQASTPQAPAVQSGWMRRQSKGLETGCDASTLKGTYVYGAKGVKNVMGATTDSLQPYRESGMESYDGQGHVTNIYLDNSNGGVAQYAKGTYIMTEYCDALVTYESGDSYLMHVSPDGENLVFLQFAGLQAGEIMGGAEYRVSMQSQTFAPADSATATPRRAARSGDADKCPIGYSGTAPFCTAGADFLVPHYGQCETGYTLVTEALTATCTKKPAAPTSTPTPPLPDFTATALPPADPFKLPGLAGNNQPMPTIGYSSLTPDRTSVLSAQGNTVFSRTECQAKGPAYKWTTGTCVSTYKPRSLETGVWNIGVFDACKYGFVSAGYQREGVFHPLCKLTHNPPVETINAGDQCGSYRLGHDAIYGEWTPPRCVIEVQPTANNPDPLKMP